MRWFHRRSIKAKLILLFTLTASTVLAIACAAFIAYDVAEYRSTMRREAATLAEMLADSSTAAVTFEDGRAAAESLATLRAETRIEVGCLYGKAGVLLASYHAPKAVEPCPSSIGPQEVRFTHEALFVSQPVKMAGERIGTIYLRLSLSEVDRRLENSVVMGAGVLLATMVFALLLGWFLQRVISRPLLHLTEVASRVSRRSDYGVRAVKVASDEIGDLVERFNEMMGQIQFRDRELKRAQDGLESRVEERTRELQEEIAERKRVEHALVRAKEAAEASNRAKTAFLANMSHELRTPLNAVIGYSEMLREDAEARADEMAAADLQKIEKAGRHLLSLINDVLDLSKIEAGRMEMHLETVPVDAVIRDVAATVEPLAKRNGNRLLIRNHYEGTVHVDQLKFRQSLLNLMSNACKFTENGTVELDVAHRSAGNRDWVEWTVRDTGIGIAPEDLRKLFRSFSQADSSATRRFGGTGLGLAISQRLCRLMGGHITVKSEPGQGSEFTIRMPANSDGGSTEQPVEP